MKLGIGKTKGNMSFLKSWSLVSVGETGIETTGHIDPSEVTTLISAMQERHVVV